MHLLIDSVHRLFDLEILLEEHTEWGMEYKGVVVSSSDFEASLCLAK